ncbi:MAG: nucleotide exchange factor GrpE, partial [Lachnospiraceae bacterium]|nr:nucleotide exchange factor GrpE [Lachnospiraceae bacterium]
MSEEEKKTAAEGAEIEIETPEETNEAPAQDPVTEETAEPKEEAAAEETAAEETAAEETEAETEPDEAGEEAGENKKEFDLFGRKKKFEKELAKKDAEIASVNDQYKRLLAEFDNYRKRTEKEKSGMYAMGAKDVIEKILPVIDNFERGFSLVTEEDKEDAFVTGMEKIYKQFGTVLTDLGVTPIEAVG